MSSTTDQPSSSTESVATLSSRESSPTNVDASDASPPANDDQTHDATSSPQTAAPNVFGPSNNDTYLTRPDKATNGDTEVAVDTPMVEESFNMKGGIVTFLVEKRIFKVHDYFFMRDSSKLRRLIAASASVSEGHASDPVELNGVKSIDFKRFLTILYPTDFDTSTLTTRDEWASVLHVASEWDFDTVRKLAIRKLFALASPVDRIVFGRRYEIPEWLVDAYVSVCTQEDLFDEAEGEALGAAEVVKICKMREALFKGKIPSQNLRDTVWRACCPAVFFQQPTQPIPKAVPAAATNISPATTSAQGKSGTPQGIPAKAVPEGPAFESKPHVCSCHTTPAAPHPSSAPQPASSASAPAATGPGAPLATGTFAAPTKPTTLSPFAPSTKPFGAQAPPTGPSPFAIPPTPAGTTSAPGAKGIPDPASSFGGFGASKNSTENARPTPANTSLFGPSNVFGNSHSSKPSSKMPTTGNTFGPAPAVFGAFSSASAPSGQGGFGAFGASQASSVPSSTAFGSRGFGAFAQAPSPVPAAAPTSGAPLNFFSSSRPESQPATSTRPTSNLFGPLDDNGGPSQAALGPNRAGSGGGNPSKI